MADEEDNYIEIEEEDEEGDNKVCNINIIKLFNIGRRNEL